MDEQAADQTVGQSVDQRGREPASKPGDRPGSGDQNMHGQVALVAGASKGIGAATAEAFAAAGAAVVLGARDLGALNQVADRIRGHGGKAIAVRTDVSDEDSMREFTEAALTEFGRLDAAAQI